MLVDVRGLFGLLVDLCCVMVSGDCLIGCFMIVRGESCRGAGVFVSELLCCYLFLV